MLIQIDPILSPDILHILRSMGHGDRLVLCDTNFPAYSTNDNVCRLDGVDIARASRAILSVFPLSTTPQRSVNGMRRSNCPPTEFCPR